MVLKNRGPMVLKIDNGFVRNPVTISGTSLTLGQLLYRRADAVLVQDVACPIRFGTLRTAIGFAPRGCMKSPHRDTSIAVQAVLLISWTGLFVLWVVRLFQGDHTHWHRSDWIEFIVEGVLFLTLLV